MTVPHIGILIPVDPNQAPPPPETRPMGRAALALRQTGIIPIFGNEVKRRGAGVWMRGVCAHPGFWETVFMPIHALHDRFPSQGRAAQFHAILKETQTLPMGNPPAITWLCRDKKASQEYLTQCGIQMPEIETDPNRFSTRLQQWGGGFVKPQFGSLGVGVRFATESTPTPTRIEGVVPGVTEPALLQRAIIPPEGWAGWSVRVLCQREEDHTWFLNPSVLRKSRTDPVVNAARGATVSPGTDDLPPQTTQQIMQICSATCAAISNHPDGAMSVELGLDLVIDSKWNAHLIEINSRPRGRLAVLASLDAERFSAAHIDACARPIRYLAHQTRCRGTTG